MKERLSNFEALRIICAVLVVFVHANFLSLGAPHVDWSAGGFCGVSLRVFAQFLCLPATYAFAILSGYFGIRVKLKSVLNLFFMLVFWWVFVQCEKYVQGSRFDWVTILNLNPFCGWFIPAYVTMLFFVPALNAFTERLGEIQLRNYLLVAIPFVMVFDIAHFVKDFAYGYSAVGLMIGYLIGRYFSMNLHRGGLLSLRSWKWYLGGYVMLIVCGSAVYLLVLMLGNLMCGWDVVPACFYHRVASYIGPFCLMASAMLFLAFAKMNFQSGFINHVARSSFPIIGYHLPLGLPFGYSFMRAYYASHSDISVLLMTVGVVFCGIGIIVSVDQVRIWFWDKLCKVSGGFDFKVYGE